MTELQLRTASIVDRRALSCNVSALYLVEKRIFDIAASLAAILILLPFLFLIAVVVMLDSPGPALFIQERSGYKGKVFRMLKFRSMVQDAEDRLEKLSEGNEASGNGCMFKIRNDPRITRFGRFIRKTSIDELPQLFNILAGSMSIVGPRPPILREVLKYDAWHNFRLSVKPGLTGLWQISGRSGLGFEEMVRLDMKYIRERSLLVDLKIIIRTIPVLFGDKQAC